ncbi:uncharacterized protein JCM6883_001551 [Sporobolomyces salmoneus]|uniref:uncharacterized protein n=1 Tax=Sporobolomyces salmoneus TaxID=183962 RepID=UPI003173CA66
MSLEVQNTLNSAATTIESLPNELLAFIASHLEEPDLSPFSLTTKTLRAITVPELFEFVLLAELCEEKAGMSRGCIAALRKNRQLCRLIKHVRIDLRWTWRNSETSDFVSLATLLSQTDVRSIYISFEDYEEYFDSERAVYLGYVSLWSTISKLPNLESLQIDAPLGYALNLPDFPALKRLRLRDTDGTERIGRLPPRLTHLSLQNFLHLDSSCLNPRLLRTLQVLRVFGSGRKDFTAITASVRNFAKAGIPSALNMICLDVANMGDETTSFLSALDPRTFSNLRTLELSCIGDDFISTYYGFLRRFLRFLAAHLPSLEELALTRTRTVGDGGDVLVDSRVETGNRWRDHLVALSGLTQLKFLTVNWRDGFGSASPHIRTFKTFPNLHYFAIRADLEEIGDAWILDRTDTESIARGPVRIVALKPFLDEAFHEDPRQQVSNEFSMEWYRDEIRTLRAGAERVGEVKARMSQAG